MDSNHLLQEIFIRNKKNLGKVATDIVVLDNKRYKELVNIEKKFLLSMNFSSLSHDFIINTVVTKCCFFYGISKQKIFKKSKLTEIVVCRQMISYILKQFKLNINEIGKILNQDHTTIRNSIKRTKDYIDIPQGLKEYTEIITIINSELLTTKYGT